MKAPYKLVVYRIAPEVGGAHWPVEQLNELHMFRCRTRYRDGICLALLSDYIRIQTIVHSSVESCSSTVQRLLVWESCYFINRNVCMPLFRHLSGIHVYNCLVSSCLSAPAVCGRGIAYTGAGERA